MFFRLTQKVGHLFRITICFSSVISVLSDITTSHSTKLARDASQVAGYVANRVFKVHLSVSIRRQNALAPSQNNSMSPPTGLLSTVLM